MKYLQASSGFTRTSLVLGLLTILSALAVCGNGISMNEEQITAIGLEER